MERSLDIRMLDRQTVSIMKVKEEYGLKNYIMVT